MRPRRSAKNRSSTSLLYGPAGLGKNNARQPRSKEVGASLKVTSGPAIEKLATLPLFSPTWRRGDMLSLTRCIACIRWWKKCSIPQWKTARSILFWARGLPRARSSLPCLALLLLRQRRARVSSSSPFRSRFGATHRLEFYQKTRLKIVRTSRGAFGSGHPDEARRDRGRSATPRASQPRSQTRALTTRRYIIIHRLRVDVAQKALA